MSRDDETSKPYDSSDEEEPPPLKTNQDKLLWRQDPKETFSDWTVKISYKDGGEDSTSVKKVDVYRLHKGILAGGPRRSEYFAQLFKDGGRFAETSAQGASTSRIELHELAAKAFPQLLDYLYSVDANLEISTETATALYHLGGYFDMRRLRREAKKFWQEDLDASTCGTYYEHAKMLHDEKIKQAALKQCAEHIMCIDESSRLVHVPDEDFWVNLFESEIETNSASTSELPCTVSHHRSRLLGAYFMNCGASEEAFQKLTRREALPWVHAKAAVKLLEAERRIIGPSNENDELTDLQQRCIQAIAYAWKSFDRTPHSDITLLRQQSPFILTETLIAFAASAKAGKRKKKRLK